jgi:serralysin
MKLSTFLCLLAFFGSACSQENEDNILIIEEPFGDNYHVLNQLQNLWDDEEQNSIHKFILDTALKWEKTKLPLNVCFFDGEDESRVRVINAANQWSESTGVELFFFGKDNIPQTCEKKAGEDIRISLKGSSLSTYRGTLGLDKLDVHEPTMYLGGFSDTYPNNDDEFQMWVLHEFGHALGLVHEHQGEGSNCFSEFDLDKLYERLENSPYYWSREAAKGNIETILLKKSYASTFDKESIMLYTFPAQYYKNGQDSHCYHKTNTKLSTKDKSFIGLFYSANNSSADLSKNFDGVYSADLGNQKKKFKSNSSKGQRLMLSRAEAISILKSKVESKKLPRDEKNLLMAILK